MSTLKQIEANRRNALRSTGPRTPSGKSASRLNALKTGIDANSHILAGESQEAFNSLTAEYYDCHCPTTPEQRALVDALVSAEWLLRRLRRVEHQIWDAEFQLIESRDHTDKARPFGEAFKRRDETFLRLQRRIDSTWRQYNQALRTLRQLQSESGPSPQPPSLEPLTPEIGFVPLSVSIHPGQHANPSSSARALNSPRANTRARTPRRVQRTRTK
jgi:hypothetical protein